MLFLFIFKVVSGCSSLSDLLMNASDVSSALESFSTSGGIDEYMWKVEDYVVAVSSWKTKVAAAESVFEKASAYCADADILTDPSVVIAFTHVDLAGFSIFNLIKEVPSAKGFVDAFTAFDLLFLDVFPSDDSDETVSLDSRPSSPVVFPPPFISTTYESMVQAMRNVEASAQAFDELVPGGVESAEIDMQRRLEEWAAQHPVDEPYAPFPRTEIDRFVSSRSWWIQMKEMALDPQAEEKDKQGLEMFPFAPSYRIGDRLIHFIENVLLRSAQDMLEAARIAFPGQTRLIKLLTNSTGALQDAADRFVSDRQGRQFNHLDAFDLDEPTDFLPLTKRVRVDSEEWELIPFSERSNRPSLRRTNTPTLWP